MTPDRAFELAGARAKASEIVTGHAHAAVNCMADGPPKVRAKTAIGDVRDMLAEFERLTFGLLPFTLEYHDGMTEAELREWAADLVRTLRGG